MRLRHKKPAHEALQRRGGDANHELVAGDLGDFIALHSEALVTSANLWQEVGSSMRSLKTDPVIVEKVHDGVSSSFAMINIPSEGIQVQREADRILNQLAIFTQMVARNEERSGVGIVDAFKQRSLLLKMMPSNAQSIVGARDFPHTRYMKSYTDMREATQSADKLSDQLLQALSSEHVTTPEDIMELQAIYNDGGEAAFPVLAELRNIIASDWHRTDHSSSVLREHCRKLTDDPSMHIDAFCDAAATHDGLQGIASMARYAIVSAGGDDFSAGKISEELRSTREEWEKIPNLQEAFNDYIEDVGVKVTEAFEAIAGPRDTKNVRLHHTGQEIFESAANLEIWGSVNGQEARLNAKARKSKARAWRKGEGQKALPTMQESVSQLDASELLTKRNVRIAVYANGRGYDLVDANEMTSGEIVEQFKLEPDQSNIGEDMLTAIEYLRQPTSSYKGVRRFEYTDLKVGNKRHGLWRLALEKAPGLKVNSNNRFYRVIYTIIESDLVIYDMLSHADFDRKYKS